MVTKNKPVTSAKKATAKASKPIENKPAPVKASTSQKALMDKIRGGLDQAAKNKQGGGGGKFNFFKMQEGKNRFRIVVPPNGPFCIALKQHRGKRYGKFATKIDLGWLFNPNNAEYADAMRERFEASKETEKMFRKYGDPFDLLFKALQADKNEEAYKKKGIGQKRVMFVVWAENAFHILETSQTIAEAIDELYQEHPDFLDWEKGQDIQIKGTGQKLKRRYGAPMLVGNPEPLEVDLELNPVPNLLDVLSMRVCTYEEKVAFLFHSYPDLVNEAGLEASDFGVEEIEEEENSNSGGDEEEE